ncbi:MAG: MBL fold metallo-hydrolase [Candidatus Woesearchaeota archaeon]
MTPSMIIKYWGIRGSVPSPLTSKQIREKQFVLIKQLAQEGGIKKLFGENLDPELVKEYLKKLPLSISGTYGGDTTCIEIQIKDTPLIMIDTGTGARLLGEVLLKRLVEEHNLNPLNSEKETAKDLHIFYTHYHWDHIQGFPFFAPSFINGEKKISIHFYGRKDARRRLSEVLAGQQQYPNFPVVLEDIPCAKTYNELNRLESRTINVGQAIINYQELTHPDSVFAYAFDIDGKKFVCATDTEHRNAPDPRLLKIARGADILYYDSQYTPEEYLDKFDWGHSTYEWAIRTALAAEVKTVVLGHHEPRRNDFDLEELKKKAVAFKDELLKLPEHEGKQLEIVVAYQGLLQKL